MEELKVKLENKEKQIQELSFKLQLLNKEFIQKKNLKNLILLNVKENIVYCIDFFQNLQFLRFIKNKYHH